MAEFDVASYLASKGLQGRQNNGNEIVYPCFLDCGEDARSKKKKLYVNTETGLYTCFVCGASGGTYLLQKHFGDDPQKPELGEDPLVRRKILNWATQVGAAMLGNNDPVMLYLLNERGLSPETILERKLGFVGAGWSLTGSLPEEFSKKELANTGLVYRDGPRANQDFFYNHLLIPYLSRGNTVQVRGRQWADGKGGKYLTGPGEPTMLFNTDSLDDAEDVIITEGEFDAMVLHQHLRSSADDRARRIAVLGLAGVNAFPDGGEAWLSNVKRIYLGLDPDDTGKRAAVALKEQLGNRARILELPDTLPKCDWSEFLLPVPADADTSWHAKHPYAGHGASDVMALVGNARGKRIFSVSEAGVSYRAYKAANPNGIKTGYGELDDMLLPGLLPGQVVVILAKTGAGKTILLCNLAWNTRHVPQLFISLEMTREEVYDRLKRIALFHNPLWTDREIEESLANVWICDENRLSERDFELLLAEFQMETGHKAELAFVDYLGYFARGARGNNNYEKTTNAIMALKAIAKTGSLTVVTPAQVNRGADAGKTIDLDDARDSGAIEETADFLIGLFRPDMTLKADQELGSGNVKRSGIMRLAVLKSRHGNAGHTISLLFDELCLAIATPGTREGKRVEDHNNLLNRQWTYQRLREDETKPVQTSLRFNHFRN